MRRLGWTLILGSLGIPILLMLGLGIAFLMTYQEAILDFRKAIGGIESNTILYDRHGQQFHSFHRGEKRLVVPLQEISRPLQLSVLAAEDSRFFSIAGWTRGASSPHCGRIWWKEAGVRGRARSPSNSSS